MRPLWRWVLNGKQKPPTVIHAEWREEDPRTAALVAITASMDAQTAMLERFAVAAESVAEALDRAERRALGEPEPMRELG